MSTGRVDPWVGCGRFLQIAVPPIGSGHKKLTVDISGLGRIFSLVLIANRIKIFWRSNLDDCEKCDSHGV